VEKALLFFGYPLCYPKIFNWSQLVQQQIRQVVQWSTLWGLSDSKDPQSDLYAHGPSTYSNMLFGASSCANLPTNP